MRCANDAERFTMLRWFSWVAAIVCFGPLILIWSLGAFLSPVLVSLIVGEIIHPEPNTQPEDVWLVVCAIAYVIAGGIGLFGLLRVLTVPRERPKRHRIFTLAAVAVGLAPLLLLQFSMLRGDFADFLAGERMEQFLFAFGLPCLCSAWLLATSWRYLLAGPRRQNGGSGEERRCRQNSSATAPSAPYWPSRLSPRYRDGSDREFGL